MVKKRKSGGHTGSSSGRDVLISCDNCGRLTPRGKAKRVTRYLSLADAQITKELRDAGAILPRERVSQWLCVSCAIHSHTIRIRSNSDRKKHERL
jgi:small subunit ribosomal protein S26e